MMKRIIVKYFWNRRILAALVVVSPAIFAFLASRVVQSGMERQSNEIKAERIAVENRIKELDRLQSAIAGRQVARAAALGTLNDEAANLAAKLKMDRLFRLDVQGDLRRIVADIHPADWKVRIAPIDTVLATDYRREEISTLQDFENKTMQEAAAKLTQLVMKANVVSDAEEAIAVRAERTRIVLDAIGVLLTIAAFIVRENKLGERQDHGTGYECKADVREQQARRKSGRDGRADV